MNIRSKMWPLECSQLFPLIWPHVLVFDPTWPMTKLDLDIIKINCLIKFDEDQQKNVMCLECSQGFPSIWPRDLVYDPRWPMFELDLDIIKTNISIKLAEDPVKNVALRVFTRFSFNLTPWPSFWPHMTHGRSWPKHHQNKQSHQVWWRSSHKCGF